MAPRGVPLPDHPDDCWPVERTYPQFEGKNLTRGWLSEFAPAKDNDDEDGELSDLDEKLRRVEELNAKKKAQAAKKAGAVKQSSLVRTGRDPLTAKPAQGLSSRSAAVALSTATKSGLGKAKAVPPSALASKKSMASTFATGNSRHIAAKIASNSTLGYSKGRAVSVGARKPLVGQAKESDEKNTPFASGRVKTLDELFDLDSLMIEDAPDKTDGGAGGDEEEECFQFDTLEVIDLPSLQ